MYTVTYLNFIVRMKTSTWYDNRIFLSSINHFVMWNFDIGAPVLQNFFYYFNFLHFIKWRIVNVFFLPTWCICNYINIMSLKNFCFWNTINYLIESKCLNIVHRVIMITTPPPLPYQILKIIHGQYSNSITVDLATYKCSLISTFGSHIPLLKQVGRWFY